MRIGLIGYGIVGKSVKYSFKEENDFCIIDPAYYSTTYDDLMKFKPNVVYVCVPTPISKKEDEPLDFVYMETVFNNLVHQKLGVPIVVKSTVLHSYLIPFIDKGLNIVMEPEFLTEKNWKEDTLNQQFLIVGGQADTTEWLVNQYEKSRKVKIDKVMQTSIVVACILKYTINSFLATKVSIMNELYDLLKAVGEESVWKEVVEGLLLESRIGESHLNVPGHDGKRGFGGKCFPKDLSAFVRYGKLINSPLQVFQKAYEINKKLRTDQEN